LKYIVASNPRRIPLTTNGWTKKFNFLQWCCTFVFIAKWVVLILQLWFNWMICVFVHQLNIMKATCSFLINHHLDHWNCKWLSQCFIWHYHYPPWTLWKWV
jgi:hypothetical protein